MAANNIKKIPILFFITYLIVFSVCAVSPFDRTVWIIENLPIVIIVLTLVFTYKFYQFSNFSYFLMMFLIILHTIGGHYTFERAPFDFVTNLFGFSRNNYDRVAHFVVGFYAYPIAELLLTKKLVKNKIMLFIVPITIIFTVASAYEILEWVSALFSTETTGTFVLGMQGDIWDAQKDMLADGLGAVVGVVLFFSRRLRNE
ncbi:DUF2238 domain-containing protein [bacterium]|nr:DUF2238 domain-containing protein [bacterium]